MFSYKAYEAELINIYSFIIRTMNSRIEAMKNPINFMDFMSNQLIRERDIKCIVLIISKPDFRL